MEMPGIALVERDDGIEVPEFDAQAVEGYGIVGFVEGGGGDVKAQQVNGLVHGGEIGDRIVTMIVQHIDDEGQLAGMAQRIGREFVQTVAIDVAVSIGVPTPTGLRVMKAAGTGAVFGAPRLSHVQSLCPWGLAQVVRWVPSPATCRSVRSIKPLLTEVATKTA